MNNHKDDPKLKEVKDVLLRLQRMDIEDEFAAARGAAPVPRAFVPRTRLIAIVCGVAGGLCVAAVIAGMLLDDRPRPSFGETRATGEIATVTSGEPGPPSAAAEPGARVNLAQQFMAAGRLRAARELLLEDSGRRSADVALALARTYDPNLVKQVPLADSEPDRAQAERWYREWHAIAKEKGLVTDGVALERLIRSMR